MVVQMKNGPCPRATQISPFKILPGPQVQQGGTARRWEGRDNASPMRGICWSNLGEGGRSGPFPRATPLSLSHILTRPQHSRASRIWEGGPPVAQRVELEELPWRGCVSQVHGKVGRMAASPKPHYSVTDVPESPQTSIPRPWQLTPQQVMSSTEWGERESRGWGYCISPGWCHKEGNVPPEKDGIHGMREGLSTGVPEAAPSALSPEPQTPLFPHETLVCSTLSLL